MTIKALGILSAMGETSRGLSQQMRRLEIISENIANAEALPDKDGNLYHRKVLEDEGHPMGRPRSFRESMALQLRHSSDKHVRQASQEGATQAMRQNQDRIKAIEVDGEKLIHDPSHPRADKDGYVHMPNVNAVEEMVDLMAATRAYEANVSVLRAAKSMAKQTFEI